MSEYLTHNIVFEDTARLVRFSPDVNDVFRDVYQTEQLAGLLGSGTRKGGTYIVDLMGKSRERWRSGAPTQDDRTILGFTFGWMAHRAADRWFKPIYAELQPEYDEDVLPTPNDIRIYHDVELFQTVQDHGREEPPMVGLMDYQLDAHPASGAINYALTENTIGAHLQHLLVGLHSLDGSRPDVESRLNIFFERLEPMYIEMDRYARFYHEPDLEALHRFIIGPNFYDQNDPLIALARSVQHGEPDTSIDYAQAMDHAWAEGSQYAKGLWLSMRLTEGGSQYFDGHIDRAAFDAIIKVEHPSVQLN